MSRFTELSGLPPQIEIESPEAGYIKGMKAVRGIVQEQGQVMSLTLENNAALYHTNKALKAERGSLLLRIHDLETENRKLNEEVAKLSTPINRSLHELEALCEQLSKANETLRAEVTAQQFPEYDTDARHAALQQMKAQAAALKIDPDVPTQEQINARLDRGLTERDADVLEQLQQMEALIDAGETDVPPHPNAVRTVEDFQDGIPDTMPGLK